MAVDLERYNRGKRALEILIFAIQMEKFEFLDKGKLAEALAGLDIMLIDYRIEEYITEKEKRGKYENTKIRWNF